MPSNSLLVRLSTHPVMTWWIRNVASRIDPRIFRATGGRLFSMGVPSMPMLTLTAIGRHSGRSRSVQLACPERDGDYLVVASAMGQQRHLAWSHNLDANPEVKAQVRGESFRARAERLGDAEKQALWPDVRNAILQMVLYERRIRRDVGVYRLRRGAGPDGCESV